MRTLVCLIALTGSAGLAQLKHAPEPAQAPHAHALASQALEAALEHTFQFIAAETHYGRVVRGAPYCAEAVTETVQALPDGNRIVRKNTATVCRDDAGRVRREQKLAAIGAWGSAGEPPQIVSITDPVAGVSYVLDARTRTAHRTHVRTPDSVPGGGGGVAHVPAPGTQHLHDGQAKAKIEPLGKQMIEGVAAEGTRTKVTIPAGQIGNERPVEIVSESWHSPELATVVMSKRTDPRFGETTYRLTRINRGEPARSLFEVPADYTIKDSHPIRLKERDENQ